MASSFPDSGQRSPMYGSVAAFPFRFHTFPCTREFGRGAIVPTKAECGRTFQRYRQWVALYRRVASSPSRRRGVSGSSMGITCALCRMVGSASWSRAQSRDSRHAIRCLASRVAFCPLSCASYRRHRARGTSISAEPPGISKRTVKSRLVVLAACFRKTAGRHVPRDLENTSKRTLGRRLGLRIGK